MERDQRQVSTLDLVGRGRFTVLTGVSGAGWIEAASRVAAALNIDIDGLQIGPGCGVGDIFGDWALQSEVSDSGCVLVRPDGHVGWRCQQLSADPGGELNVVLLQILGRAT